MSPMEKEELPVPPTFAASVEDADTTPDEFVTRTPDGDPETVRSVVEAVPKYAVPETPYAVPKFEKFVVEAPAEKSWSAVQVLATEREAPEPAPTHVPLIEKHPPPRSMPRAKVEVADVPVTLR